MEAIEPNTESAALAEWARIFLCFWPAAAIFSYHEAETYKVEMFIVNAAVAGDDKVLILRVKHLKGEHEGKNQAIVLGRQ